VPASSLTAVAADTSPPALKAPPFTPKTAADAVATTTGETATSCPSPDPATYHRSKKNLTGEIVVHANVCAEVGKTLPQRRQLPDLRSSLRSGLGPASAGCLRALRQLARSRRGRLRSQRRLATAGNSSLRTPPRALFGLASGSRMTARRFCAASCRSLFITADTTTAIFHP
jgi:hypothetical protein